MVVVVATVAVGMVAAVVAMVRMAAAQVVGTMGTPGVRVLGGNSAHRVAYVWTFSPALSPKKNQKKNHTLGCLCLH